MHRLRSVEITDVTSCGLGEEGGSVYREPADRIGRRLRLTLM